jgi:hypothetical protein
MRNYVQAIDLLAWWDFAVRGSAQCIYATLDWAFLGMYKKYLGATSYWASAQLGFELPCQEIWFVGVPFYFYLARIFSPKMKRKEWWLG